MLTKGVCFLQDNVPVHNSHIAQVGAWSWGYNILILVILLTWQHLTHLYMKSFLKGKCFQDDEALISGHFIASNTTCKLRISPLQQKICYELWTGNPHLTHKDLYLYACEISASLDNQKWVGNSLNSAHGISIYNCVYIYILFFSFSRCCFLA